MEITIRRATTTDVPALSGLGKRTFYDTFTGTCSEQDMQEFLEAYFNTGQVLQELSDTADFFFFAEAGGVPVGYVRIKEDYTHFPMMKKWKALELKRIYVDKPFHGTGVAQKLLRFVEAFAMEQHYEVLWLGVWEHNHRAKKFYLKNGFVDSGYTHEFPIGNTPQTDNWLWKFY